MREQDLVATSTMLNVPAEKVPGTVTWFGNLHQHSEGSKIHSDRLHNDNWEVEISGTVKLRALVLVGDRAPQIQMEVRSRDALHEAEVQGEVETEN